MSTTGESHDEIERSYLRLLAGNKAWVARRVADEPTYFDHLSRGQQPRFLWIGCSDSRMPDSEITGTEPGEMFVHRNVANLVVGMDMNFLSVLQYGVEHLKVEHVIVCGHYGCGGVAAAASNQDYGLLNVWLHHIKDVHRLHQKELDAVADERQQVRRLTELNVVEQVYNLGKTEVIQRAWHDRGYPEIHGWVYDLSDGIIDDLGVNFRSVDRLEEQYRFKWHVDG